ncbi:probable secreted glycoprotein [Natronomonas moolapensis 8.8.11]|uniref:Probable secreted glycoprotein n=1 Tax=Natronomonas moolapensis (strain DSM 18674 / CECT 7526 / JCM 14361 / 8.8.11) TaxID=268739 RepID=M1Y393_NATM8|nr:hypothetical protein [Natronomonas moolapensis]CCQ36977.1 probable secreted glycoprotein [Natronomonas moolapensis 8.8.11]
MVPTRRRVCALLGSAALAGCSDALDADSEADGETGTPAEEPTPSGEPTATEEPTPTETDTPVEEATPEEPDLRDRESELPELIRESLTAARDRIDAAVEMYADSAGGDPDAGTPLASVSLSAEPDRIDISRELSTANDRLSGATSRASRRRIDDDRFQRLTGLLGAEIGTLRAAVDAHQRLARGYRSAESVVELADQRAYRLAESNHEELGERRSETTDAIETARTALEPIEAASGAERTALQTGGHGDLLDRLEAGAATLGTYHDALEAVPSAFSDVDDAEGELGNDDERAFSLSTLASEDLEAAESTIESADPPASVEPVESSLLGPIRETLETARAVRDEAAEGID